MKITIDAAAFSDAITFTNKAIETSHLPILGHILFEAKEGGGATLVGTNLETENSADIDPDYIIFEEPCSFALPAQTILKYLKNIPKNADRVVVDIKSEGSNADITSGGFELATPLLSADDFPRLTPPEVSPFKISAENLNTVLNWPLFATSSEEVRYYLNGVHLCVKKGSLLQGTATDGHKLARDCVEIEDIGEQPHIIVHRKAIPLIMDTANRSDFCDMAFDLAKLQVTSGAYSITTKLIDGTFPDADRVIPNHDDSMKLAITAEELINMCSRMDTVSDSKSARGIKLSLNENQCFSSAKSSDKGSCEAPIQADYQGDPIEIGANSAYLLAFGRASEGSEITAVFGNSTQPIKFTWPEKESRIGILMPMRV